MSGNGDPGALAGATGAGMPCHATAAGTPNIAQGKARGKRAGLYLVTPETGAPFTIEAKGREARARDGAERRCRMTRLHPATFAASLDPATLAALGLAGARIWGALT